MSADGKLIQGLLRNLRGSDHQENIYLEAGNGGLYQLS